MLSAIAVIQHIAFPVCVMYLCLFMTNRGTALTQVSICMIIPYTGSSDLLASSAVRKDTERSHMSRPKCFYRLLCVRIFFLGGSDLADY
ncbi:hypothetical protein BDR06DRAFT_60189 [Suillus hirtellus]|nr:hypothetical protein BDR06DRAFT_58945 [Suillus hirtellus]KAG2047988.1 hypothetical protein BDR06DRAFT_60189 [Suillus hirtellus]